MKTISRFTKTYLENTKVRQGDFDWDLFDMSYELTNEEEALRQLNCLIESIVTDNDTYTLESFKSDVQESIKQVNQ
jgi:hypothetical protein